MAIKVTLNNKENINDLICFNTCPNVISIENNGTSSTYESVRINVGSLRATDTSKKSTITINGYTIQGTDEIDKVKSRRFYRNGSSNRNLCAISIVNALKTVPQLSMNYDIMFVSNGILSITAKNSGYQYDLNITTNNLTNFNIDSSVDGTTTDNLSGQHFSKIYCDLYYNDGEHRQINAATTQGQYKFLTSLQKEYYKDSISFNVTPALQSISNYNNSIIWKASLYGMIDSNVIDLGDITDNYMINGYLVNQGGTYIDMNEINSEWNSYPAINVNRGKDRTQYNNSLLYVYEPNYTISLYKLKDKETVNISYLESDETETYSETHTINLNASKDIDTYVIPLNEEYMRDSYYIDLQFSFGFIRLNVINPPYANAECNRVYWYNSYGGVSYFDFLGDKSEERKTDVTTYNKSLLDFYKEDIQEQEIVYFRDNSITVSLTSHLIEQDGLYQLYDLQNSYKSWIKINDVNYYIIITSLTVDEPSDNVYTATIKYKYSLLDSFA